MTDFNCTGSIIYDMEKHTPHKKNKDIKIIAADIALDIIVCPKCNTIMTIIKDKKRYSKYKCTNCGNKIKKSKSSDETIKIFYKNKNGGITFVPTKKPCPGKPVKQPQKGGSV